MPMDKEIFKAEVKKQLSLHKWSYSDLADRTKYTQRSIGQMMYDLDKLSDDAMHEIASALEIELD